MNTPVLQKSLPFAPWLTPSTWRLPGTHPIAPEKWLIRDDAFDAQMQLRDWLIAETPDLVHAMLPSAKQAADECLQLMLDTLSTDRGYQIGPNSVTRPDGAAIPIDREAPLLTMGRLTQSDVCILTPGEDEHLLTGAILCFPAHWTLAQKIGRPLTAIHGPVDSYGGTMAKRVQRLFDALRPGQLLTRANAHLHKDPELFTPRPENAPRASYPRDAARFLRSERQVLRKLPKSNAVVFTIHTFMVALGDLSPEQRATLDTAGVRIS